MKAQHTLISALVLTTATFAALPGAAVAQNEPFDRFNRRTPYIGDSTRPYQQHTPAPATAALANSGFNNRTGHVGDSTRPYQRPLAAPGDELVARQVLFRSFGADSARQRAALSVSARHRPALKRSAIDSRPPPRR